MTTIFVNTLHGARSGKPRRNRTTRNAMPKQKLPGARRKKPRGQRRIALGVLNERLGYFMRRAQVWIFQDFIARLAILDLSPAQFSVLAVIAANAGLSQAELAGTLGIERARLVRLLHRLEERGMTRRLPSSADGRRHALRLTRSGQRVLARAVTLSAEHEAGLVQRFGARRYRMLIEALRQF
jgi:DNA-binding MarR family transcriptional regulator